jgi:hypothetical protein
MPVRIEQLPGESIISAIVSEPFHPEVDMPAMFSEFIRLRLSIQGDVALIVDVTDTTSRPDAFSQMMFALAEASQGIRASQAAGVGGPPITIFVGSGLAASLASQAIAQEQYGGVRGHLCTSLDEALSLAREKLSA